MRGAARFSFVAGLYVWLFVFLMQWMLVKLLSEYNLVRDLFGDRQKKHSRSVCFSRTSMCCLLFIFNVVIQKTLQRKNSLKGL